MTKESYLDSYLDLEVREGINAKVQIKNMCGS